ncbi:MAG: nickel transporter [Deltaproteobacteria bacterium]|nr:nickel transporter [Deltaproteobacteria bacterium]
MIDISTWTAALIGHGALPPIAEPWGAFIPGAGMIAGVTHVLTGPDHLAAVAPLAMDRHASAWRVGLAWGMGHSLGAALLGLSAMALHRTLDLSGLTAVASTLVGLTLIVLGVVSLRRSRRIVMHTHPHEHDDLGRHEHLHVHLHSTVAGPRKHAHNHRAHRRHTHTATGIGVLHGVAGVGHLVGLLPSLALGTTAAAVYLVFYMLAAVAAMTAVGALLGRTITAGGERLARLALPAVSVLAIGVGVVWIVG